MKAATKRALLYAALGLAVGAAAYMDRHSTPDEVVKPGSRGAAIQSKEQRQASDSASRGEKTMPLVHLDRGPAEASDVNPFDVRTWAPTAPTQAVAAPIQEKPTAPPVPFSYAGKMEEDDGRWVVYLVKGETSYNVHQGETFADVYRLNSINSARLEIEYLPLAAKQTLPTAVEQ